MKPHKTPCTCATCAKARNDILSRIEEVVSDDFMENVEDVLIFGKSKQIEDEKVMIRKLQRVYELAHGFNTSHSCFGSHEIWRKI